MNDDTIPKDILIALFRALVWCGEQITSEQREAAWAYLEQRNPHEEMGY